MSTYDTDATNTTLRYSGSSRAKSRSPRSPSRFPRKARGVRSESNRSEQVRRSTSTYYLSLMDIHDEIKKQFVKPSDIKKYRSDPLTLARMLYGPSVRMLTPSLAEKIGLHQKVYGFFTDNSHWIQTGELRLRFPRLLEFQGFVEGDREHIPGQTLSLVSKEKAQYIYFGNEILEQCGPWWGTGSACNPVFVFMK